MEYLYLPKLTIMAYIEKNEIERFQDLGLVNERAFKDLATLSREMRLKRGETGFSNMQMKNFTVHGHTCSPQVKEAILNYFEGKVEEIKKIIA